MKHLILILGLVFFSNSVFSQEKYTKHTIAKGETINGIAEQYNVKASAIYKINPEAHKTLQLKQVLLIPNQKESKVKKAVQETTTTVEDITHQVLAKETIYGITKQYGITAEALIKANPTVETEGLKIDQIITIPGKGSSKAKPILVKESKESKESKETVQKTTAPKKESPKVEAVVLPKPSEIATESGEVIVREVLPKETKYGISKQYGITVQDLERQNPDIVNNLPVGFKLTIRKPNSNDKKAAEVSNGKVVLVKNEKESAVTKDSMSVAKPYDADDMAEKLIQTASDKIGTRYRSGGTTSEGFDCSGLMFATFSAFDIKLPRSSIEMATYGEKINTEEAQKGDLIFFKTNGRGQINHVGMVVEVLDGEIKFIHSSNHSGVIISSTKESYYEKSLAQVNRVL